MSILHQVENSFERIFGSPYPMYPQKKKSWTLIDALDLGADAIVVEYGSLGEGFTVAIARRLAELGGSGTVIALATEQSEIDLLEARSRESQLENRIRAFCLRSPPEAMLPVKTDRVDRFLSVRATGGEDDPPAWYAQIARVLKPGGKMLLCSRAERNTTSGRSARETVPQLEAETVVRELSSSGLHEIRLFVMDGFDWIIRANKPL